MSHKNSQKFDQKVRQKHKVTRDHGKLKIKTVGKLINLNS